MSNITVTLPDPGDGYEWELFDPTVIGERRFPGADICYRKVRSAKEFDWSQIGPNVLVVDYNERETLNRCTSKPQELVIGIWQAHIGGDPCPVHADATIVEYRRNGQTFGPSKASNIGWDIDTVYRVTGRAHGYKYP